MSRKLICICFISKQRVSRMKNQRLIILIWNSIGIFLYGSVCLAKTHTLSRSHRKPSKHIKNKSRKTLEAEPDISKTCNFYAWDLIGACRYRLYHRLIRDNIYEGKGGKKVSCEALALRTIKTLFFDMISLHSSSELSQDHYLKNCIHTIKKAKNPQIHA